MIRYVSRFPTVVKRYSSESGNAGTSGTLDNINDGDLGTYYYRRRYYSGSESDAWVHNIFEIFWGHPLYCDRYTVKWTTYRATGTDLSGSSYLNEMWILSSADGDSGPKTGILGRIDRNSTSARTDEVGVGGIAYGVQVELYSRCNSSNAYASADARIYLWEIEVRGHACPIRIQLDTKKELVSIASNHSPLQVHGGMYGGIHLVGTDDPDASPYRIYDGAQVKALACGPIYEEL